MLVTLTALVTTVKWFMFGHGRAWQEAVGLLTQWRVLPNICGVGGCVSESVTMGLAGSVVITTISSSAPVTADLSVVTVVSARVVSLY